MRASIAPPRRSILVTVGTDHHPFNRLIDWAEEWAESHEEIEVVVQHGFSRPPAHLKSHDRVDHHALTRLMEQASVVVTHGGGGTITQCWRIGKVPVIVARRAHLREHVDDHQVEFGKRLAEMGLVSLAETKADFWDLLSEGLFKGPTLVSTVDMTQPTDTTKRIGELVENLVTGRRPRRRFSLFARMGK